MSCYRFTRCTVAGFKRVSHPDGRASMYVLLRGEGRLEWLYVGTIPKK